MKYRDNLKGMTIVVSMLVLALIIGLTFGGRERVTKFENLLGNVFIPVQKAFNAVANGVETVVNPIFDIWENERLVEELELENQELRQALVDAALENQEHAELNMLKEVYQFTDYTDRQNMVSARVVSKDPGNWYNMFMIDRGLSDGVTKNSAVFNGRGLIGLAYEIGDDWAKVVSIIDNKSSIGFKLLNEGTAHEGIIDGGIDGKLSGVLFDPQAEAQVGEILVTSGKGLYPEGIIIGEIAAVLQDEDELLTTIEIAPRVDFRSLDRVLVLPWDSGRSEEE